MGPEPATPRFSESRLRLTIRGCVQGVGFRPFLHQLANQLGLRGCVWNDGDGVVVEAEGEPSALKQFLLRAERDRPPLSFITSLEPSWLPTAGYRGFAILPSRDQGARRALVMPDIATCPDCLREILDPADRRYQYPFTNCTRCGPRFTILERLPYDRANTTMRCFQMCPACRAEYEDPASRRFHAEPNACPECGPRLDAWDPQGAPLFPNIVLPPGAANERALAFAAKALRDGQIVAFKGIGGFQLLADATSEEAVRRLRRRKLRAEKPFAIMVPSLQQARSVCEVGALEERLLCRPESPIVLLQKRIDQAPALVCESVAPGNSRLGVMLPYSPLHHLLLRLVGAPLVATSGNLSDEPICTDEWDAVETLRGVADAFLVHNRKILRHVDDSVVQVALDREMILRRARGYAPLPIPLRLREGALPVPVLAVGGHLKNTVALGLGQNVFVSQHIGDLETAKSMAAFHQVIHDLEQFHNVQPTVVVADRHPGYLSTQFAEACARKSETRVKEMRVQHHLAHVLACMAENELEEPLLGVAWDGTGFGDDGTIWGGEFFRVGAGTAERVAHLRPFPLPGPNAAVREPRRCALGILFARNSGNGLSHLPPSLQTAFSPAELSTMRRMLSTNRHCATTTSAGRLFDAVSSLLGLRQRASFEGQAAMALEFAAETVPASEPYPISFHGENLDWEGVINEILLDLESGVRPERISARFHASLADGILRVASAIGMRKVALSGGCFQNRRLLRETVRGLRHAGFEPYWHQRIPPNDGGISLGQVVAALRANV